MSNAGGATFVPKRAQGWQFSLGSAATLTGAFAVGFAVWRAPIATWYDCALAFLTTYLIAGLARQARDLARTLQSVHSQSAAVRFGWQWAIGWRLTLVAGMLFDLAVRIAAQPYQGHEILFMIRADAPGGLAQQHFTLVVAMVAMGSGPANRSSRRSLGIAGALVNGLGLVALAVWCIYIACDFGLVPFLVHCAIWAVRMGSPHSRYGVSEVPWRDLFHYVSLRVLPIAFANCLSIAFVARNWATRGKTWWLALVAAIAGLAAVTCYAIWVLTVALPGFNPDMREGMFTYPGFYWAFGLSLTAILCLVATYGSIRAPGASGVWNVAWHEQRFAYHHERAWVAAALLTVTVVWHGSLIYHAFKPGKLMFGNPGWSMVLSEIIGNERLILLATEISCCRTLLRWWRQQGEVTALDPAPLDPARFAVCSLLSAAALFGLAASLAGFGVAVWMVK